MALAQADPEGQRRVLPLSVDGATYWVKQPERLHWRMRLQKGDAASAFERERTALRALAGRGLPVARLVAEAPGLLAVEDCGTPLRSVLSDRACPLPERLVAARAGGAALAALHAAGVAHGRPDLRDICWRDGRATLIDFERCPEIPAPLGKLREDLFLLVFSAVVALGRDAPEVAALLAGYRRTAPAAPWQSAARLARRLRLFAPVLRLLRPLDGPRGELAAVAPALALIADPPPDPITQA
ncbi:MAG: hypothetical protein ACXIUV_07630 [Alkalilacustris sp.]